MTEIATVIKLIVIVFRINRTDNESMKNHLVMKKSMSKAIIMDEEAKDLEVMVVVEAKTSGDMVVEEIKANIE